MIKLPFLITIAIVLAIACGLALTPSSAADQGCHDCTTNSQPERTENATPAEQLAEKYAPIVYLRNQREACDKRGSPYAPVPVEFVFEVEEIVLRRHQDGQTTEVGRAITSGDLYGKDNTYFLDLPGDPKRPGCVYERDYLARTDAYTPIAYAHVAKEEGRDGIALQYWMYYYFNDWNNTHEGDWEMIQLTFAGPSVEDALQQAPLAAGYSQHGSGERADWDDSKLTTEDGRPVSFVAAGANANQFEPNIILGRGDNGTGFGCDDASPPSRRVSLEAVLVEEPTGADSAFAWLAFDGRWGELAPWEFNGPTGPNDKRAWTQPFSWQDDLRPSSIIVPSNSMIGPNAVNVFCDAVWYLSTPIFRILRLPNAVLLGGMVAALGAATYTATRTRYRPIEMEPLRARRRFGQVLTTASRLYRRNYKVFLGIGAVFVPVGVVVAALQWLVFRAPYVDTVAGFFSTESIVEAAIAISMGSFASSIVYWFVVASAVAGVARIDTGEANSVLQDYRDIARNLGGLLLARVKVIAIVTLLAVTVIGIPWAIRHATRWAFAEEAMILDGVGWRESTGVSGQAVDGRWFHTFLCLAILATVGFLAGPLVGFLMLFVTSASVAFINITSSVIFAAVAPFVGIAHALLYFDLQADDLQAEQRPEELTGAD